MADRTLLVMGLPGAGKTTFLAALWNVLRHSKRAAPALRLDRVDGDQGYLNEIRDTWARCEPMRRTLPTAEQRTEMHLRSLDDERFTLTFPDLSGETFNDQWERAQCTLDYMNLARTACGVVLFAHATDIVNAPTIVQVVQAATAAGATPPELPQPEPEAWTHQMVGTQVRLVELLQILRRPPIERERLHVAVIISAWDSVRDDLMREDGEGEITVAEWLANALPLLAQFLEANAGRFPSQIYGVSAQGGDLVRDRERLLALGPDTWRRVMIDGPACEAHDISAPIRWLVDTSR
jgi:hypothetical protein